MKTIPLTRGKVALVDDQDYDALARHKWGAVWCKPKWYAARHVGSIYKGTRQTLYMHRVILNPGSGFEVDHKNGDGLADDTE